MRSSMVGGSFGEVLSLHYTAAAVAAYVSDRDGERSDGCLFCGPLAPAISDTLFDTQQISLKLPFFDQGVEARCNQECDQLHRHAADARDGHRLHHIRAAAV